MYTVFVTQRVPHTVLNVNWKHIYSPSTDVLIPVLTLIDLLDRFRSGLLGGQCGCSEFWVSFVSNSSMVSESGAPVLRSAEEHKTDLASVS